MGEKNQMEDKKDWKIRQMWRCECWVSKMVIPVYGESEGEALCD